MNHFLYQQLTDTNKKKCCILVKVLMTSSILLSNFGTYAQSDFPLNINYADSIFINKQLLRAQGVFLAGYTDSASFIYEEISKQSNFANYKYGQVKSNIGLGNIAANTGKYELAIQQYQQGLSLCNDQSTRKVIATLYNNIANIYKFQGALEKSMINYTKAINIAERLPSELPIESLYTNIAGVLAQLKQAEKALYYLEKAERLATENNNNYSLSDIYNNKGTAYSEQKNFKESEYNFKLAWAIATKHGYVNVAHSSAVNLGIIYLNINEPRKALSHLKEAEKLIGYISPYYKHLRYLAAGKAYLMTGDYLEAEKNLQEALQISEQLRNAIDIIQVNKVLTELYEQKGDYKKAFEHISEERKLNDSLNLKDITDNIAQLEIKYRTAEKNKELANNELIINRQLNSIQTRNFWIAGAALGLILLSSTILFSRRGYKNKQRLRDAEIINSKKQQELNEIRAKVSGEEMERSRIARNLHDDVMVQFSAVKLNLSALMGNGQLNIAKEKLEPVVQQLDKATAELRHTAHNLMPDMLLQEGLADAVFYFCNTLQKNVSFSIVFHQLGELPRFEVQFELVVYRMIQELLQNIIKHAKATEAIVQLSYNLGMLSCTVEDNGMGIPGLESKHTDGMGLKSISHRVSEFNGKMEIESSSKFGTSIRIEFEHPITL